MESRVAATAVRAVVLAPSYNNAGTLRRVLDRIAGLGLPIIVVNDGCTDQSGQILSEFQADRPDLDVRVVTHARNMGKAAALQSGFAAAHQAGFTHAVTIDTDGQLSPEQIPRLLSVAEQHPEALVIGARDAQADGTPWRSSAGRRISNAFVRLESGVKVADSQCGLRVYPLAFAAAAKCKAGRFGYETEIITRAGWMGVPVLGVPVTCLYAPQGQRVSHFRPVRETLRAIGMHARLVARALAPWPMRAAALAGRAEQRPRVRLRSAAAHLVKWLSPVRAWRELRQDDEGRVDFATAVAAGVFIANLPIYGAQTLLSLYVARRLHLNPLAVVAGSQVSTPPIGPLLVAAAIALGHVMLHHELPQWTHYDPRQGFSALAPLLLEWTVGALAVGTVLAVLAFVVATSLCRAVSVTSRTAGVHTDAQSMN